MTWYDLGANSTIAAVEACPNSSGTSVTYGRSISDLHFWNGRVYAAYGDYDNNTPGLCNQANVLHILGWDHAANDWFDDGNTFRSYGTRFEVVGDRLAGMAIQPRDGSNPDAFFIAADHSYVSSADPGVGGWHMFDICAFNGRTYLAGAGAPTTSQSSAMLWYWTGSVVALDLGTSGYRMYGVFELDGYLYASSSGAGLYRSPTGNAGSFTSAGTSLGSGNKFLPVTGAVVYLSPSYLRPTIGNTRSLRRYTGAGNSTTVFTGVINHTLGEDGLVYVLRRINGVNQIWQLNADGTNGIAVIASGIPDDAASLAVTQDNYWVGTIGSHLWRYGPGSAPTLPEHLVTDSQGTPVTDSLGNYVVHQ